MGVFLLFAWSKSKKKIKADEQLTKILIDFLLMLCLISKVFVIRLCLNFTQPMRSILFSNWEIFSLLARGFLTQGHRIKMNSNFLTPISQRPVPFCFYWCFFGVLILSEFHFCERFFYGVFSLFAWSKSKQKIKADDK